MMEIHSGESGLNTSNRCFQIIVSPQDDEPDFDSAPVQLGLIFSHTEKYPDEPPLLNVRSLRGIHTEDLGVLKEKLQQEAPENLGMAMIYTLVTSAKEWLSEQFGQDSNIENGEAEQAEKEDIVVPHGEPVTVETFLAWRERFEAELALERAKKYICLCTQRQGLVFWLPGNVGELVRLQVDEGEHCLLTNAHWLMPESALTAPKDKKLTGRQWFESGRPAAKGAARVNEVSDEEDEEDVDFDDDDFEDDEEDMLEHYLAEKSNSSSHSSRRAN